MRHFGLVVGIDVINGFDGRHDLAVGSILTVSFICTEPARFSALAFEQVAKEADGGLLLRRRCTRISMVSPS